MRKITSGLIIALCSISALTASKNHKTGLMLRDHQHRAAVFTIAHQIHSKSRDFGSRLHGMLFYHQTDNAHELGKAFGINGTNCVTIGTAAQVANGTADVENNLLLHDHLLSTNPNTLQGTVTFNPKQTTVGTHMQSRLNLDKVLNGLYVRNDLTFIDVSMDLNASICDKVLGAVTNEMHTLKELLGGHRVTRSFGGAPDNRYSEQEPLYYAKIGHFDDSKFGLENLEAAVGWTFYKKEKHDLGINITLQTPTGNKSSGEYILEPRIGSAHTGWGAGISGRTTLWQTRNNNLEFFGEANYRYQLEAWEKRILGIKGVLTDSKYCHHVLSPYYLLSKVGHYTLIPAANVLTLDADIRPGSQVDAFALFSYKYKKLAVDLGYNFYWKEEEDVSLKRYKWQDNVYGIAAFNWQTCNNVFTLANAQPLSTPINYNNIDTNVAATPEMLSHSIFGSAGYLFELLTKEVLVSVGAAYEWGKDYSTADSFMFWLKAGVAF